MAAIDKMYLKDYCVFDDFRLWCLIHNPKLFQSFYHWNMTYEEWKQRKENGYKDLKEYLEKQKKYYSTVESLRDYYKNRGYDASTEQLEKEVEYFLKQYKEIQNKDEYIDNYTLPITNFSCKEDRYLLWHCPIKEVREYLTKQCGYKERWYYKLFFKH